MGREGFAFTNAFTPTAICTPARASLLTGKRPGKRRVLANPEWSIAYRVSIPEGTWTYTQELRDAGYNVGIVGNYHCGHNLPGKFGADDDTFWGAENPVANEEYAAWLDERGLPPVRAHDLWCGELPGGRDGHILAARLDQPEEATFERFLADRAITRLRQYAADWKEARRPFCLDVHFFGPHLPLCWGGCPKDRFVPTASGARRNYLCEGYRAFYSHASPALAAMARLLRSGQPASDIMDPGTAALPAVEDGSCAPAR